MSMAATDRKWVPMGDGRALKVSALDSCRPLRYILFRFRDCSEGGMFKMSSPTTAVAETQPTSWAARSASRKAGHTCPVIMFISL